MQQGIRMNQQERSFMQGWRINPRFSLATSLHVSCIVSLSLLFYLKTRSPNSKALVLKRCVRSRPSQCRNRVLQALSFWHVTHVAWFAMVLARTACLLTRVERPVRVFYLQKASNIAFFALFAPFLNPRSLRPGTPNKAEAEPQQTTLASWTGVSFNLSRWMEGLLPRPRCIFVLRDAKSECSTDTTLQGGLCCCHTKTLHTFIL